MKVTHTMTECTTYTIVNHIEAIDRPTISSVEHPPLRCTLIIAMSEEGSVGFADEWRAIRRFFDKNDNKIIPRWHLVKISIHEGLLRFTFADLLYPIRDQPEAPTLTFYLYPASFLVTNERAGTSEPDTYHITYYGREGKDTDRKGEFVVARIEERRDGQHYAEDTILRRGAYVPHDDDKYYLSSYRFD